MNVKQAVAATGIFIGGTTAQRFGDGSTPVGSCSPEAETLFTDFDYRNNQNLEISHNLPPDS